jgi:hypothetical protein
MLRCEIFAVRCFACEIPAVGEIAARCEWSGGAEVIGIISVAVCFFAAQRENFKNRKT